MLCNIVDGFRKHVPYEEFQDLQAQLVEASHRIANNAECIHEGSGWKQNAPDVKRIKKLLKTLEMKESAKVHAEKDAKREAKSVGKRKRLSSFEGDLMYAEVLFAQDTDWFKNELPLLVPNEQDRSREFVVMECGKRYKLIPGYAPKGKVILQGDEPIIQSLKLS